MVVLRSGKKSGSDNCSLSSVANKSNGATDRRRKIRHAQAILPLHPLPLKTRSVRNKNKPYPVFQFATRALKGFNETSPQKYQLLKVGSFKPVSMPKCVLYHINFTAKHADVAAALEEMFFTELTISPPEGLNIRLCVSLGPTNSISGARLNGCYICRNYCNVWHPKDGFVRGGDGLYKTVQDICDINLNNAIPDHENHLPMLKQVSGSRELEKEGEYISEQVDDASLYATEALKFYVQRSHCNYELVKPGFGTRVLLPKCTLFHVNFQAKETVPVAPEKLFFAELTSSAGVLSVKRCFPLSLSELESGDETGDKTNGCYYCHEFNKVRHPMIGGFVRGGDSLYVSKKEFCC